MLCARTVRATAPARAPAPAPARRFRVRAVVARATGSDGDRASDPPTTRRVALGVALASSAAALAAPLVSPAPARAADASDWSSPGLGVVPDQPANYQRTPLGVVYEQINDGVGEPAKAGDVAVFQWILRRANGYFIYGTIDCGIGCGNGDPSEYKLGPDGKLIAGLDELLTGMRPGEKRRALIPPAAGYVSKGLEPQPPEFGQKRQVEVHASEPLVFEVKLVKTRQRP